MKRNAIAMHMVYNFSCCILPLIVMLVVSLRKVATFRISCKPKLYVTTMLQCSQTIHMNASIDTKHAHLPTSFSELGLNDRICSALSTIGLSNPTSIQAKSFHYIVANRDTVLAAETGSGKTLAYLTPLIDTCITALATDTLCLSQEYPPIVVLVPTKELCVQVTDTANRLLTAAAIERQDVFAANHIERRNLWTRTSPNNNSPLIFVCTPKYLADNARGTVNDYGEMFRCFRHIVLDEADMLLDGSYLSSIEKILEAVKLTRRELIRQDELHPNKRITQFVLAAATIPNYGLKSTENTIKRMFPSSIMIKDSNLHKDHPNIKQEFIEVTDSDILSPNRVQLLRDLVSAQLAKNNDSLMIFVNTAAVAAALAAKLRDMDVACTEFHNLLSSECKIANLASFQNKHERILVCTDSSARGWDIDRVNVIQAEFALNVVQYLHRIGRSSRGGREGVAISIFDDRSVPLVRSIREREASTVDSSFSRRRGFRKKLKKGLKISDREESRVDKL